ncbi:MAG TPA: glycolate oxidase subunit GlcF [Alphaproteobacteria bacterium]|nr:glycolate oxidase subunit GlcF [Alphaproteobacteria bacterium]
MQTAFTPEQLTDAGIAEAAAILKDCVHYGFCTAVCPTWVLLRDENDGPRGRIDLIKAMLEAGGRPEAKTVRHIDQCLSCNACMTTCAAKVDYLHLADVARIHIERHFKRPLPDRALRALIAAVVPNAGRFRRAMALAGLARPFARVLPGRLGDLIRMAPRRLPPASPIGPGTYPAEGDRRMRVALLAGCAQQALAPHINEATVRLLTRHGCEVVIADTQCCGGLTLHMGKERRALAAARASVETWSALAEDGGLDAIVVNASGCGTTVKDYGHLLRGDALGDKAARIGALTRDVSEILAELGLNEPDTKRPITVAYHDACSLQHAQLVTAPPRALLRAAGYKVVDVPEKHFCCGSAGTYNLLQPKIAGDLGARKARHIESTGAAAVAAGNLGCLTQIGLHSALPAVHTVELLDWATGGPMPPALDGVAIPEPSEADTADAAASGRDGPVGIW